MPPVDRSLLPTPSELVGLSDDQVKSIVSLAAAEGRHTFAYDLAGLLCGTVSFLSALAIFVYLVMHQHEGPAGVVLGTTVLAIVGRMIRRRDA